MQKITTRYDIQVAEDLEEAADYIEQHGWTRHAFENSRGRVCVVGALQKTLRSNSPDGGQRYRDARYALTEFISGGVYQFNDNSPSRSRVLKKLREIAQEIRNEQA